MLDTTLYTNKHLQFLTSTQKENYERDGFLIIPNFFTSAICELLIERASQLIDAFELPDAKIIFSTHDDQHTKQAYFLESSDNIHFFFEENAFDAQGKLIQDKKHCINKIGHALHELDPIFYSVSRMQRLHALSHDLEITKPVFLQSMYICKQPYIGGEVNCHQDSTFLFVENKPVTGFWFALQDATIENGCLWAIPGGHHIPLKSRMFRNKNNAIHMEIYDKTPWDLTQLIPLEVKRGTVIVLHGLLPHMSYENHSPLSRHAYTLHLMSEHDHYAKTNWLQREKFSGF